MHLDRRGLTERRKYKYKVLLRKFKKIKLAEMSKKQVDQFFLYLKNSTLSDETKQDYWNMFRIFVRWMKPKIDLKEYKLQVKKKFKLPEDILSLDEVKKIILIAKTVRDRALISLLYDSGCRPSELLNLKNKDITFDENGLTVSLDGKTGMRKIPVITTLNCSSFLKQWQLQNSNDQETCIFDGICIGRLDQIVKRYSEKAGITKRVYTYIFRHSRATHLANYLTEQQLKIYLGWSMDSKMAGTYVHMSGKDLAKKVLSLNAVSCVNDRTTIESLLDGNIVESIVNLNQKVNELEKKILLIEGKEPVKVEA